jgi:hypothetical protein
VTIILWIDLHIPELRRGRSGWKINARLLRDRGSIEGFSSLRETWKGGQARYADVNLWWMEYVKTKHRKFWQAEERQLAGDTMLQENFYLACVYEILEHREATQETAT